MLDSIIFEMTENLKVTLSAAKPVFEVFKLPLKTEQLTIDNLKEVIQFLAGTVQKEMEIEVVQTQMEILFNNCKDCTNFEEVLVLANSDNFQRVLPDANIICQLAGTASIPVASSERGFSSLKLVKNFIRNRIGDDRLDWCLMLFIEKELVENIELDYVLKKWSLLKHRRIKV